MNQAPASHKQIQVNLTWFSYFGKSLLHVLLNTSKQDFK